MAKPSKASWLYKSERGHRVMKVSRTPRDVRAAKGGEIATTPTIRVDQTSSTYVDPAGQAYVQLLGLKDTVPAHIVETVRKGLPFRTFEHFIAATLMSSADAAALVNIPTRTLSRRKQKGRLEPEESDRLLRASRILGRAIELFEGDRAEAKQWLARPQRALGGVTPFGLASTEVGALAVERLIDQLEQGVFV